MGTALVQCIMPSWDQQMNLLAGLPFLGLSTITPVPSHQPASPHQHEHLTVSPLNTLTNAQCIGDLHDQRDHDQFIIQA